MNNQSGFDEILNKFYKENGKAKVLDLVNPISFGVSTVHSKIFNVPLYKSIQELN